MQCYKCQLPVKSVSELFRHFRHVHGLTSSGSEVRCPVGNCPRAFLSFCKLKYHMSCHDEMGQTDSTVADASNFVDIDKNDNILEDDDTLEFIDQEPAKIDLQRSLMTFLTLLGSKANVTNKNIQTVVENIEGLIQDIQHYSAGIVYKLSRDLGVDESHAAVKSALVQINGISDVLSCLSSVHKRNKWLSDEGNLIMPQEIALGTREEQRSYLGKHSLGSVTVSDTYQFLSLSNLLPKLLENDSCVKLMNEHRETCKKSSQVITDFMCTSSYLEHEFFQRHPNAFILNFFIDAFETVNPLGSHTAVHKLEGLYCTLGNIPLELNSKTSSIFLIGLWYAQDVKVHGYEKILEPVVKELKELEGENGLPVLVHGKLVNIHAILSFFSADNLGANSLFGFMEGFTAHKFCRFCHVDKSEIQTQFLSCMFKPRSRIDYEECVRNSLSVGYCASETGIKKGCPLNSLRFFHCTEQSIVDCMHDLLEGVVPSEIALVLGSLIDKRVISLDSVNRAIHNFDYSLADRNSKPPALALPHMRLTASETWCLLRNLPLMIGVYVERGDEHWRLLILLLDCVSIIMAPAITKGMIEYLTILIQEHHTVYKELYPDKNLLPKHHFLVHYPEFMQKFGPLSRYWCMRFEAKHRFGKEVAGVVRNFRNICKTIAMRTQQSLAYNLLSNNLFCKMESFGSWSPEIVASLDESLSYCICTCLGLSSHDEVYVASSLKVGHYELKPGCVVVTDVTNGNPEFGLVAGILSVAQITYVAYRNLNTVSFDDHFYSYAVNDASQRLHVKQVSKLKDYHPLSKHAILLVDNKCVTYIATRYRVF